MDDLCSLWAMCSSMRGICGDPALGRRVVVDRCKHKARSSNDLINYFALLARLTQVDNPEACLLTRIQIVFTENHSPRPCLDYLTRAADGGHNVVAYLVAILLYRHNDDASDDYTARRYMRRVEDEEESWVEAAGGGGVPMSRWLSNKGCVLCRHLAIKVIYNTTWGRLSLPSPV